MHCIHLNEQRNVRPHLTSTSASQSCAAWAVCPENLHTRLDLKFMHKKCMRKMKCSMLMGQTNAKALGILGILGSLYEETSFPAKQAWLPSTSQLLSTDDLRISKCICELPLVILNFLLKGTHKKKHHHLFSSSKKTYVFFRIIEYIYEYGIHNTNY